MERALAHQAVTSVLERLSAAGRPVTGAMLKSSLLREFPDFAHRPLGFVSFADFLRSVPGVQVDSVPGSDVLVTRAVEDSFTPPSVPTIRRDFWEALVAPRGATLSYYLPTTGDLLRVPEASPAPEGSVRVPVVTADEQRDVVNRFLDSLPESPARDSLRQFSAPESDVPFLLFHRRVLASQGLIGQWRHFRTSAILRRLEEWAASFSIDLSRIVRYEPSKPAAVRTRDGQHRARGPGGTEEALRAFVISSVRKMTFPELSQVPIPARLLPPALVRALVSKSDSREERAIQRARPDDDGGGGT